MNISRQYLHTLQTVDGYRLRVYRVMITGLTAGADNVVPHTLPAGPSPLRQVTYRPQGAGGWHEYQPADGANLYVHVDADGPTSFVVEAAHPV